MELKERSSIRRIAQLHGAFNVVGGLWPLAHMRSFEAVLGPKKDRWLVYTVAGLMITVGAAQLRTSERRSSLHQARLLGAGCAATLGGIDVVYAPQRRISLTYLVDGAAELGWLAAWASTRIPRTA